MLSLSVASLYLSEAASRHCQSWQIIPPFTAEHPQGLEGSAQRSHCRILNRYLVNISYRRERRRNIVQKSSQKQCMFARLPLWRACLRSKTKDCPPALRYALRDASPTVVTLKHAIWKWTQHVYDTWIWFHFCLLCWLLLGVFTFRERK